MLLNCCCVKLFFVGLSHRGSRILLLLRNNPRLIASPHINHIDLVVFFGIEGEEIVVQFLVVFHLFDIHYDFTAVFHIDVGTF